MPQNKKKHSTGVGLIGCLIILFVSCQNHQPEKHEHKQQGEAAGKKTTANLKQIMQGLNVQLHRLETGIMTSNRYLIKVAAEAIAYHPAPKGGIKPYLRKNKEKVKAKIPAIDKALHGAAKQMIKNANDASFAELQQQYNTIASSCVACHQMFRD